MESAKYVGRIGALAVALGIGAVVASPAWADTKTVDSGSLSTSSPKPQSGVSGSQGSGGNAGPAGGDTTADRDATTTADVSPNLSDDAAKVGATADPDSTPARSSEPQSVASGGPRSGPADATVITDVTPDPSDDTEQDSDDDAADVGSDDVLPPVIGGNSIPAVPTVAEFPDPRRTTRSDQSLESHAVPRNPVAPNPDLDADGRINPSPDVDSVAADRVSKPLESAGRSAPKLNTAVTANRTAVTPAPATLVEQPQTPIDVLFGAPTALLRIASESLRMLFTPQPGDPGDPPLLLGVLAFVHREIQRTFFNSSPHAVADVATTSEMVATTITVLDNDIDPETGGDVLTVTDYTQARNGKVALNPDGTFTYTPCAGFAGTDTFTYTVSDEASPWHVHSLLLTSGHASTTTVSVAVAARPGAVDDSVAVNEDSAPTDIAVLANDVAPDTLTVTSVGTPDHGGTVAINTTGTIAYTPAANYNGVESFTYTVNDGTDNTTATVTVSVAPVDDALVIESVTSAPGLGNTWTVTVAATDPDGDAAVTLTANHPDHITITPNGNNQYTVTADAAWALTHPGTQIGVTAMGSNGTSEPASVTVDIGTVNNAVGTRYDAFGEMEIPALPAGRIYADLALGYAHLAVLYPDGTAEAFDKFDAPSTRVPALPDGLTYTDIDAGKFRTLLLRSDGLVFAVGDGYTENDIPELPAGVTYTAIAAGGFHTGLLRSDGTAVAVGSDQYGQTDIPELPAGLTYTAIAAGSFHTVLLRSDGTAVAAGSYVEPDFTVPPRDDPRIVIPELPAGLTYTAVAAGWNHTVLLRSDGTAVLIDDSWGQPEIPDLPLGLRYVQVAAGNQHTLLLRSDGVVVALNRMSEDPRLEILKLPAGAHYTAVFANGINSGFLFAVD